MKPDTNDVCDTLQVLNFKIFVDSVKLYSTQRKQYVYFV